MQRAAMESLSTTRLTRSSNGLVGGVCAGLGNKLGVDPMWIRLAWVATVLLAGTGVLLYLAMWWVLPREDNQPLEPVVWVRAPNGAHPPLQRTVNDRRLLGVCGGVARRYDVDPAVVRLLTLLAFVSTGPLALAAYLIAAVVIPSPTGRLREAPHPVEL